MICVTNRVQCTRPFLEQLEKIALAGPETVILRERDLDAKAYEKLAAACLEILRPKHVELTIHSHVEIARKLGVLRIHMPLAKMEELHGFHSVSTAVHSIEELWQAMQYRADFVIAGHVYKTDCKLRVPPRGTQFIKCMSDAASVPVYAIGGITPEKAPEVLAAGAKGVCVMSAFMKSEDPQTLIRTYRASSSCSVSHKPKGCCHNHR